MVESIVLNQNKLFTASVYLEGEFGEEDINIGVPVIINSNGWDRIVPLQLDDDETALFKASAQAVRKMNSVLKDSNII
jgi:malate dehydrogenase